MRWNVDCSMNVHVYGGIRIFVGMLTISRETILRFHLNAFDESLIVRREMKEERCFDKDK